jgi:hypothetical protein
MLRVTYNQSAGSTDQVMECRSLFRSPSWFFVFLLLAESTSLSSFVHGCQIKAKWPGENPSGDKKGNADGSPGRWGY